MTGKLDVTKGTLPSPPLKPAFAKTKNVPKMTADAIFARCELPDVGDKYAFLAHLIAELTRYPDDVLEMAVPIVARQHRKPVIADIVKICDDLYAPRRDAYTVRERERSQLTERMLIEAFNEKQRPDPGWYDRQKDDLAARGLPIGNRPTPIQAKNSAIALLQEKYGMTDEIFNSLPNAPERGDSNAGTR